MATFGRIFSLTQLSPAQLPRLAPVRQGSPQRPYLVAGKDLRPAIGNLTARMANEPDDAGLTGVTRSLQRRLLALNLRGTLQQPIEAA